MDKIKNFINEFNSRIDPIMDKLCSHKFIRFSFKIICIVTAIALLLLLAFPFIYGSLKVSAAEFENSPDITPYSERTSVSGNAWAFDMGWTASAGYGIFDVSGTIISVNGQEVNSSFDEFCIGYVSSVAYRNTLSFYTNGSFTYQIGNSGSFVIKFDDNAGPDAENSRLLSWLSTGLEVVLPSANVISAGSYLLPDEPFDGLFADSYGIIGSPDNPFYFTIIGSDESFYSISRFVSNDSSGVVSAMDYFSNSNHYRVLNDDSWTLSRYRYITILDDYTFTSADDNYDFCYTISNILIPYTPDDSDSYNSGFEFGYALGQKEGYDVGYTDGLADSFLGNFFGGVLDALDNLNIVFGYSFLAIVTTIVGLMFTLWILKLIAGG